MNAITKFYDWLTPSIPFEFIKPRSADDCAALLASKAGTRSGPFFQRLRVEVTQVTDQQYSFFVSPHVLGYFIIEARGTISVFTDAYSQIEGTARTRPTLMAMLMYACVLAILGVVTVTAINALFATNAPSTALPALGVIAAIWVISGFFMVQSHKWTVEIYTDMVLGLLLRSV